MRRLLLLVLLLGGLLLPVAPAAAQGRVTVANPDGEPVVDPAYATTLTVRGTAFQAVEGGHGGVYVFFGHVRDGWRPSQGGRTGEDYFYVPDSESRDNQGFQQFVAFPGSDTASSAQATMSRSGAWSVTLTVPGAVFDAFDRDGGSRSVDCRTLTCGVITVGAHGVTNATNETFTPVRVEDLYAGSPVPSVAPTAAATAAAEATAPTVAAAPGRPLPGGRGSAEPVLEVDRGSAAAGHVLAFTASGLVASRQYSVVLDDGVAAAGPFTAGADGSLSGVVTLPADLAPGTHVLRVWSGEAEGAEVGFALLPRPDDETATPVAESSVGPASDRWGVLAVLVGAAALLAALARRLVLTRRRRA